MRTHFGGQEGRLGQPGGVRIALPKPVTESEFSVEEALAKRRSVREYRQAPLTLGEVGQMLWAAQGATDTQGQRTAPSAGALYPLEVYLLAGGVEGLEAGVYRYLPEEHILLLIAEGDRREELGWAALGQNWVREGAGVIVFCVIYERMTRKYGERGIRYVHMEVGSATQNVYLQAESLGLGTVLIGAFYDSEVKKVLGLTEGEQPLGLMPMGRE